MTPKIYPQYLHTPKKFSFLKNPKEIEIQNFEPQKIAQAYIICMYENIRVPPSPEKRTDGPKGGRSKPPPVKKWSIMVNTNLSGQLKL